MDITKITEKRSDLSWLNIFLFPICLVLYELIFRLVTAKAVFCESTLFVVLFSLFYGCVGYLLSTLLKNKRVNGIITLLTLIILPVVYLVEYFVYREFKVFYDINTVFGGATDAVGGFSDEIWSLIFSPEGMLVIFIYFIPAILYLVFCKKTFGIAVSDMPKRITVILAGTLIFSGCLIGIRSIPQLDLAYGKEYSYQSAVDSFGLLTAIRLDLKEMILGSKDGFENIEALPEVIPTPDTEPLSEETDEINEPKEEPVVYTPNVMDIDFSSMQASGKVAELNAYVSSLTPSMKNEYTGIFEGKNLIFITAEAFCAEVLDPQLTPTLYRMATKGIQFTDYYQPAGAGTTGGEYQNIFGMLPVKGGMSFKSTADDLNYFTMGSQLNRLGYFGMAFHNNDYTYYDRHKTHINLGYSEGYMGYGNGMEKYVTSQWPQSDLEMIQGTLPLYLEKQPFNIYYMSVSGHSAYNFYTNAMSKKNQDKVAELEYSNPVKAYIASQLELENALTYLLEQLEKAGISDDTVICIASDHFPYGLDNDAGLGRMPYLSELYGYKVNDVFSQDHNRLILWCGSLEDSEPIVVDTPTSSLDILPTLSNLFGTEFDSRLMPGRDVLSDAPALVFTMNYNWKTEYGTYMSGRFTPADEEIELPEGYVESVSAVVRNKVQYCRGVLETDYFRYLFEKEGVS
ncbi:MAG: LTA synthase family protein [Clostridia bacterium]|nr:LTA synthase family protein [Clostridia bacterium]